jgi:competence ComEA-like helix-hairpin-helix protein
MVKKIIPVGLAIVFLVLTPGEQGAQEGSRMQQTGCVDLNTASVRELQRIVQIGPARAEQIVALRRERPFRSVDELARVNGIAAGRLREIKTQGLACVTSGAPTSGVVPTATLPPPPGADSVQGMQPPASCVDINTAGAAELERIVQLGPARAQQVIALRQQRPFGSVEELTRVTGISAARLSSIKAQGLACVR